MKAANPAEDVPQTFEEKIRLLAALAKRIVAAEATAERAAQCELFLGNTPGTPRVASAGGVGALQVRVKAAQRESI